MQGYIYKITNSVNGKYYLGSTTNLEQREYDHWHRLKRNDHDNPYLQASWNKYGAESFSFTVFSKHAVETREELYKIEQDLLVANVGTDLCYNLSREAIGPPVRFGPEHHLYQKKQSPEHIEKRRLQQLCKPTWNKGKECPQISASCIGRVANNLGKPMSDAAKQKLSQAKMGKKMGAAHPNARAIMQLNMKDVFIADFPCASAATRALGFPTGNGNIAAAALGRIPSAYGFKWKYKEAQSTSCQKMSTNRRGKGLGKDNAKSKCILQLSLDGLFIAEHDSSHGAARAIGAKSQSSISQCANGKVKTAYGFKWKYKV